MGDLFKVLFGVIAAPLLLLTGFFVMRYTFSVMGVDATPIISIMIAITPLWLPFVLFWLLYEKWMEYVHKKFRISQGRTTLRIKVPAEIFKSPEAMENVLAQVQDRKSVV